MVDLGDDLEFLQAGVVVSLPQRAMIEPEIPVASGESLCLRLVAAFVRGRTETEEWRAELLASEAEPAKELRV